METKITRDGHTSHTHTRDTPGDSSAIATARATWTACAPLLAGVSRMRLGVRTARGVLEYRTRDERPITSALPSAPAAVRVYGPDGCCVALCLDLDVSRGGTDAVAADAARLTAWLQARGARVVTDHSPTGGVHIYLPLAERMPYDTAREIVEALATTHPTLDPGPHRSLKTGCIRPPGSAHKHGGHQQLTMPLAAAYDTLRRPNPASVLAQIRTDLRAEIAAWHTSQGSAEEPTTAPTPGPVRALSSRLRRVAETGTWDRARYSSPSEARQAVIAGAVTASWSLADVAARLADGRWPGLAAMYARYPARDRHRALSHDWHHATSYVTADRQKAARTRTDSYADRSHTSLSMSRGGPTGCPGESPSEHDHVRSWRTVLRAVELHRFPGRAGHLPRFLLRAMGEAAHKTGSRYVSFGTRSLAVATGVEFSTVAAALRRLAAEPGGWVDLVEAGRGESADTYALTIPSDLEKMAADLRWDRGQAHALRPAFRELGHVAAFVFEAVEAGRAASVTALVPATGLSRDAVAAAVATLGSYGLLERSPAGTLVARPEQLSVVAELLGALEAVGAQLRTYARQRAVWHAFLTRHEPQDSPTGVDGGAEDWWWPPDDADPGWSLLSIVAA